MSVNFIRLFPEDLRITDLEIGGYMTKENQWHLPIVCESVAMFLFFCFYPFSEGGRRDKGELGWMSKDLHTAAKFKTPTHKTLLLELPATFTTSPSVTFDLPLDDCSFIIHTGDD